MNIGEMRYIIEIYKPTQVDSAVGLVESFTLFKTLKAGKKEISGTRILDGSQVFNTNRIDWTIHYRPQIDENMKLKYNNKYYKILYIREIGYREGLVLETELIND